MKKIIIGIIIGEMIFGAIGVIAATTISSKNVTYKNKTVGTALDELYNEALTGKELVAAAITNKGITTASTDTYETMATNINNIDIDHTEIIGKISNLESKHNSDVSSLTSSINSINQSLSSFNKVYTYQVTHLKDIPRLEGVHLCIYGGTTEESDLPSNFGILLMFVGPYGYDIKLFQNNYDGKMYHYSKGTWYAMY